MARTGQSKSWRREFDRGVKGMGYKNYACDQRNLVFYGKLNGPLALNFILANTLEYLDAIIIGNFVGELVDSRKQVDMINGRRKHIRLSIDQVIAAGHSANGLDMMRAAGIRPTL